MDPCKAELTILGRTLKAREPVNHVSEKPLPESWSVFIGGFPDLHGANQVFLLIFVLCHFMKREENFIKFSVLLSHLLVF